MYRKTKRPNDPKGCTHNAHSRPSGEKLAERKESYSPLQEELEKKRKESYVKLLNTLLHRSISSLALEATCCGPSSCF